MIGYNPVRPYIDMTDTEIEALSEKRYQNFCKARKIKSCRRWSGVKDTGKFGKIRG